MKYEYYKIKEKVNSKMEFISKNQPEEIKKSDIPKKTLLFDDIKKYFFHNNVKEINLISFYKIDEKLNIDTLGMIID